MAGKSNNARRDDFENFDEDTLERYELSDRSDEPTSLEDRLEGLLGLDPEPEPAPAGHKRGPGTRRTAGPKLAQSEQRSRGEDRRKNVIDTRPSGLERRRGPGRRLPDFVKSAEEGEMSSEQFLFLQAIETFKKVNNKMYPNWTDVLEVVRLLGYRKVQASGLNLPGVDDWTERADAPSNVRDRNGVTHKRHAG